MKKTILILILIIIFMAMFGWTVGSIAHWFYYTAMIILSKMVLGTMYAIPAVIIIGLLIYLFMRNIKN